MNPSVQFGPEYAQGMNELFFSCKGPQRVPDSVHRWVGEDFAGIRVLTLYLEPVSGMAGDTVPHQFPKLLQYQAWILHLFRIHGHAVEPLMGIGADPAEFLGQFFLEGFGDRTAGGLAGTAGRVYHPFKVVLRQAGDNGLDAGQKIPHLGPHQAALAGFQTDRDPPVGFRRKQRLPSREAVNQGK